MSARFDVSKDDEGQFHFHLKAANGETVAESQAYRSVADLRAGMAALQRAAAEAHVPEEDAGLELEEGIHMHFEIRPPAE